MGTNSCPACRAVRPHTRAEWATHHPHLNLDPEPRKPNPHGTLEERCAWLRERMTEREMRGERGRKKRG